MLVASLLLGLLAACAPAETPLSGEERAAALSFSEPKTDELMVGLNAGDYAVFSADFDEAMQKAMTESQFETFKQDRDDKLGAYVSRDVKNVVEQGEYYAVIYDARFTKDDAVTMRVVFRAAQPHEISGLWFDK
jgi:hypothetical protein